MKLRNTWQKY